MSGDIKIKEERFCCRRGELTIRGTEYRPEGNGLPVAIVSHGFMAFQDTVRHYARELAAMGYAAYCFDFCGGCVIKGKSDGATNEMSVLTEVEDLKAVLQYALERPYTSSEDTLLMGCSQGGFVSALTAAELRDSISKLVLFYPALCIPDDARSGRMMLARFDPNDIPDTIWCGPMKLGRRYVEDVIRMDPYKEISGFNGDVLIVHGTKDSIVKTSYSEAARKAYLDSGAGSVSLELIEGGQHGFSDKHDRLAIGFLRQFLGK